MDDKLTISIGKQEKKEYDLKGKSMPFAELERKILLRHAQRALQNAVRISEENGLAKMSNKKINSIIKEMRKGA